MLGGIWRFRHLLRRYRVSLAAGCFFTLASAMMAVAQPWPLKVIIDNVIHKHALHILGYSLLSRSSRETILDIAVVAYLIIFAAGALLEYLGNLLVNSSGERMTVDLRAEVFARLQRLSLRFHATQRSGDLITRLMRDIDRVQTVLVQTFSVLLPNLALLGGMVLIMLLIDPWFTLIALAVSPLLFLLIYRYTLRIRQATRRARSREGALAARAGEVLGAIRVVQAFTGEELEDERFSSESSHSLKANLEAVRLQAQFGPLVDVVAAAGVAVVLFLGTHRVMSGTLSLGLLVVFLSYLASLYRPMKQLSRLAFLSGIAVASAERLREVLDAENDVSDRPGARRAPALSGRVEFEGVSFAYAETPVLRSIDLEARPGEVVALVGPTGAGKSTLVSLIPRFFDPQEGRVLIDGRDVRDLTLQSLRSQVAFVLQEPLLFEGSVFDNIAYGQPEASETEVLAAARYALVDDFVRHLPDGYATRVSERAASLSGGERQRISIARALVRNAPIVILDEPTSALDPQAEILLIQALRNLMAGRTTFVIAHRMSTISGATQVLVLDRGRVVERGTHEELMRMRMGLYRSFLEAQLGQAVSWRPNEAWVP